MSFVQWASDAAGSDGRNYSSAASTIIDVRNVTKSFGKHRVLRDINLSVATGEVVVLCGPSGSGKSTLLRCINGLEPVDLGHISVAGKQIIGSKLGRLSPEIGMVFQSFNLFPHLTIRQNLVLAPTKVKKIPREAAEKRAQQLLERVGIPEKIDAIRTCCPAASSSVLPLLALSAWSPP
jgi:ABC-type polar amino acid transport system ATPase subunit